MQAMSKFGFGRASAIPGMQPIRFELPEERRVPLLEGLDQLSFIQRSQVDILAFELCDAEAHPWLDPD